jgi:hypothetical protein
VKGAKRPLHGNQNENVTLRDKRPLWEGLRDGVDMSDNVGGTTSGSNEFNVRAAERLASRFIYPLGCSLLSNVSVQ